MSEENNLVFANVRKYLKKYERKRKYAKESRKFLRELKRIEKAPMVDMTNIDDDLFQEVVKGDDINNEDLLRQGKTQVYYPMFNQICYYWNEEPYRNLANSRYRYVVIFIDLDNMVGCRLWAQHGFGKTVDPNTQCGMTRFKITAPENEVQDAFFMPSLSTPKSSLEWYWFFNAINCDYRTNIIDGTESTDETMKHFQTFWDRFHSDVAIATSILGMLFIQDHYPFAVYKSDKETRQQIASGNYRRDVNPRRIVYLTQLPGTVYENTKRVGEGTSKSSHKRRGYWVTLRAKRFENHPLYKVPNGIYRRPTWVGPTVSEWEDNIYQVLLD